MVFSQVPVTISGADQGRMGLSPNLESSTDVGLHRRNCDLVLLGREQRRLLT